MANSKDFEEFSEQDFVNHPYFQDWVVSPDEEKKQFWQNFLATYPEKKQTIKKAKTLLEAIVFKESWPEQDRIERSLNKTLEIINRRAKSTHVPKLPARTKPVYRAWWTAAAALILFVIYAWWFVNHRSGIAKPSVASTNKIHDIAPGGDKAILTLGNGTKVILDTASNGAITKQGSVTIIKLNGQLAYNNGPTGNSSEVVFNTITTPKGGQYQLILPDGTKVWLNAASSLKFPTAFEGKERRVELMGEGYFEVTHDVQKPFHVDINSPSADEGDVQVLGTHFNINSYRDEPYLRTTLLEGRVMIKRKGKLIYLNPGQQAVSKPGQNNIQIANDVDVDEVVAWKNGLFVFNNAPLEDVMRQIERWYNVVVVYEGSIPQDRFNGNISRNTNLSEVLKVLEYSNIRFRVEGKTIIVLSN